MRRFIAINSCSITGFRKQCFPVPKLDNAYEMVMFIGVRILFTRAGRQKTNQNKFKIVLVIAP